MENNLAGLLAEGRAAEASQLVAELAQFTGTQQYFRHGINRAVVFTEGVKHLAERAGAFWLLDEIAIANLTRSVVHDEPQQIWKLRREGRGAILSCDGNDGNGGNARLFTKAIPLTDFLLGEFTLCCFEDSQLGRVIFLPSEN